MTYNYLAFFMGLFGSVHCAVMCGPLLLAVSGRSLFSWRVLVNRILYQVGRICTYGMIGLLLGALGSIAMIQGWQRGWSLSIGVILFVVGLFYLGGKKYNFLLTRFQSKLIQPFAKYMAEWLFRPGGAFFAGVLNGFLPCGMVYMALASAVNADSPLNSFIFMILFGLGTLPLLLIFSFVGTFSSQVFKSRFNRLMPFLYLIMGIWFILRGANLDIPYLSPLLHIDGTINCVS